MLSCQSFSSLAYVVQQTDSDSEYSAHIILGKLDLAVKQHFVHLISLVNGTNPIDANEPSAANIFLINLDESMGPGRNLTHGSLICSRTRYQLLYGDLPYSCFYRLRFYLSVT